ncbi:MAG: hypothetical protein GY711_24540, partial [bacterium]|nr:hypothetical protein [bacterium]
MAPPTDLDSAIDQIDALARENKILREENAILRKGKFGRSTERIDPGQLTLAIEGWLGETAAQPEEPASVEVPSHKRRKKKSGGNGRGVFPPHLPRNVFELDGDEVPTCSCCAKPMKAIGEEATERGHIIPATMIVNRYVRKKWA